jgi:MoaA/NifB/PqqE/SkfB family radical SAM enzyme
LSLAEIVDLARSVPTLKNLMISGGEPFLRQDIVEICQSFARHCRLDMIDIPTSGTLVDKTLSDVERILRAISPATLSIGISLDGMKDYHDDNRGVPGTFDKAVECCERLLELKRRTRRLRVNILTTLASDNREEILALETFVAERFPQLDNLYWGVVRGESRDLDVSGVEAEDLASVDERFLAHDTCRKGKEQPLVSRFYELRRLALEKNRQPVPCVAASRIAVVYDDGSVAPCEMLPTVGSLKEDSFDRIWSGEEMRQARKAIAAGNCSCTHECFLSPSFEAFLLERPMTLVRLAGCRGLMQWFAAKCNLSAVRWHLKRLLNRWQGS